MTTKTKRKTKAKATKRRKPRSELAWIATHADDDLTAGILTDGHSHDMWERAMGGHVYRVRITVVPRGAKR